MANVSFDNFPKYKDSSDDERNADVLRLLLAWAFAAVTLALVFVFIPESIVAPLCFLVCFFLAAPVNWFAKRSLIRHGTIVYILFFCAGCYFGITARNTTRFVQQDDSVERYFSDALGNSARNTTGFVQQDETVAKDFNKANASETPQDYKAGVHAKSPRAEQIAKLFDPWDGSPIKMRAAIKAQLGLPDSYKHVASKYVDQTDSLIVKTVYNSKSATGALLTNTAFAVVDLNGNVRRLLIR